jgi:hypothetical protein
VLQMFNKKFVYQVLRQLPEQNSVKWHGCDVFAVVVRHWDLRQCSDKL